MNWLELFELCFCSAVESVVVKGDHSSVTLMLCQVAVSEHCYFKNDRRIKLVAHRTHSAYFEVGCWMSSSPKSYVFSYSLQKFLP